MSAEDRLAGFLAIKRRELAPLIDFVVWDVARRQALGQPHHVLIGDRNHLAVEPKLLRTEVANALVAQPDRFGRIVMVVEHADAATSQQVQGLLNRLSAGDVSVTAMVDGMTASIRGAMKQKALRQGLEAFDQLAMLELAKKGASFVLPDRRSGVPLNQDQSAAYDALASVVTRYNISHRCSAIVEEELAKKLNPEELATLRANDERLSRTMFGGPNGMEDLASLDAGIAERVIADGAIHEGHATVVLLYGSAHLMKQRDLDDRLNGLHMELVPDKEAMAFGQKLYQTKPHLMNDLPQVAWLHFDVKPGDELLIMDEQILKAWHQKKHGTVLSDAEAAVRVRAAQATYLGFVNPEPDLDRLALWEVAAGKRQATKEEQEQARLEFGVLRPTDKHVSMVGTVPGSTGETISDYQKRMAVPACYEEARTIVEALKRSIVLSPGDKESDVTAPKPSKDPIGNGGRERGI